MRKIILALFVLSIALIGVSCVSAASDAHVAHVDSDFGVSCDHCDSYGLGYSSDNPFCPDKPIGPTLEPIIPPSPFGPTNPKM